MSLNKPGVVYDPTKDSNLQDNPIMAGCDPEAMLWQEQALKTCTDTPNLTQNLTITGYQSENTWRKGVPMSHKRQVHVHVQRPLGIEGRLAPYKLVGPTWQLNVNNVHVPFGDATDAFFEQLTEAYRQLAMMGPPSSQGTSMPPPQWRTKGGGLHRRIQPLG